jgi:hypothetical protein
LSDGERARGASKQARRMRDGEYETMDDGTIEGL